MLHQEDVLVPFQASPLPPGPWLVFAPHADDETFGMGGSLLRARTAAVEVHLVVLTDGSLGGDGEDLVHRRHREVARVGELLQLRSVQCWDEKDRGLSVTDTLVDRVVRAIAVTRPACVFFPGPLELHPDHRSTALLVWAALQTLRQEATLPQVFSYEISVQNPVNYLIDISAELEEKQALMRVYASQVAEHEYPQLVTALNKTRSYTLSHSASHAEGFFKYRESDLQQALFDVIQRFFELYR